MAYSVGLSPRAEAFLKRLAVTDDGRARQLASLLLRLEKDPRPEGSRDLEPSERGERIWAFGGYRITYRVDDKKRRVDVGVVRERPRKG